MSSVSSSVLKVMDGAMGDSAGHTHSFAEDVAVPVMTDALHGDSMDMGGSFCSSHMGGGMVMYMDGFRFSLVGDQPCLNLYFPGWTLDTHGKFVAAMIGVVLLSILVEAVSKVRFVAQRNLRSSQHTYKRTLITVLHGFQALVGYILMLATMTFSVELLFCVVLGLGLGYAIFYEDGDNHVTTNPCCNFIQGEADERELNSKLGAAPARQTASVACQQELDETRSTGESSEKREREAAGVLLGRV